MEAVPEFYNIKCLCNAILNAKGKQIGLRKPEMLSTHMFQLYIATSFDRFSALPDGTARIIGYVGHTYGIMSHTKIPANFFSQTFELWA